MKTVVGVDLSTQSCTVEVRDVESFEVIGRARMELPPTHPPVSEQNTDDWLSALIRAFADLSEQGIDLTTAEAISVSGQCHGLVPLDEDGQTIRPVKLWNDTTSARQIDILIDKLGAATWVERCGSLPTAAFTISKLAWLIENEPENAQRIRKILLPHDWVTWKLTGEYVSDRSEASGTGYFNSITNSYDYGHLRECFGDLLPWEDMFPVVRRPEEIAGHVTAEAADALGIPFGIPVAIGGGDQHVSALGLGIDEGDVVISLGTSGVVFASTSVPIADPTGNVDGVANVVDGWLPLICTLNSTKVTDWAADLLGVSVKELDQLALDAPADGAGVPFFAAYLDGERSPAYPGAAGVISGITGGVDRSSFAAASFFGVTMGLLRGMDAIEALGVNVSGRITVIGGGARSAAYRQILADLTGRTVEVINEPEATARGACVQALAACTGESVVELGSRLRPPAVGQTHPRFNEPLWSTMRERYLDTCDYAATTSR